MGASYMYPYLGVQSTICIPYSWVGFVGLKSLDALERFLKFDTSNSILILFVGFLVCLQMFARHPLAWGSHQRSHPPDQS